jgi:hypothetical protein
MKIKERLSYLSQILNNEKSNIDDIIGALNEASKILKESKIQFEQSKNRDMKSVVLSGLTGAGKTTLSHYLEGSELEYKKLEDKSKKLFVSNKKMIDREIGHNNSSTTFFPNIFTIKDLPDHQIIDLAGLWDNNGIFVQIANSWILSQLISQYKTAKFLIVTDSKELDLAKGQPFIFKMKELLGNTIKSESVFSLIMSHAEEEKVLEDEEQEESEKIIKIIEANKSLISEQLIDCLKQNASSLGFFCKPTRLGKYDIPNQWEKIIRLIQNTKESKLDNFFEVPISEQQTFIDRLMGLGINSKSFIQILLDQDLDYYVKNNIKKLDFGNLRLTLNSYRESDEIIDILGSIKKSFIDQQLSVKTIDYELLLIESLKNISEYFPKREIEDVIISHKNQISSKVNEIDFILNKIMNGDKITKTINSKILTLKAPYITSEQILRYLEKEKESSIEQIEVYSGAITFNKDMKLPGKNLILITKNYSVDPDINFNITQKINLHGTIKKLKAKDNTYDVLNDRHYWYNETDIQYIANGLITDYNVVPALGATENKTLETLLNNALTEYYQYHEPTFIPLNIRGNHWVAMCLLEHCGQQYVLYKDSLGEERYRKERQEVESLIKKFNVNTIFIYHSDQEQTDNSSCGIFALQNMKIMSKELDNREKFINDFKKLKFATQQQANYLRHNDFAQLYKEQLQYSDKMREVIRQNHSEEIHQIKDIIGLDKYQVKALGKKESLDSTKQSNTLGIDISLPVNISKGYNNYKYIITATLDVDPNDMLEFLSQKFNVDKACLIQALDNPRTIIINKNSLQHLGINFVPLLSSDFIDQKIKEVDILVDFSDVNVISNPINNEIIKKQKIEIDLSGQDGEPYNLPAEYNQDALPGRNGKDSGDFYFVFNRYEGNVTKVDNYLNVTVNGGNGGKGQSGSRGKDSDIIEKHSLPHKKQQEILDTFFNFNREIKSFDDLHKIISEHMVEESRGCFGCCDSIDLINIKFPFDIYSESFKKDFKTIHNITKKDIDSFLEYRLKRDLKYPSEKESLFYQKLSSIKKSDNTTALITLLEDLDIENINQEINQQITIFDGIKQHGTNIVGGVLVTGGVIAIPYTLGLGGGAVGTGVTLLIGSAVYTTVVKRMQNIELISVISINNSDSKYYGKQGGNPGIGGQNGIKIVNGQKELGNIGIIGESGDTGENGLIEFGIAITLTCSMLEDKNKNTGFILTASKKGERNDQTVSKSKQYTIDKKTEIGIDQSRFDSIDLLSSLNLLVDSDIQPYFTALIGEEYDLI